MKIPEYRKKRFKRGSVRTQVHNGVTDLSFTLEEGALSDRELTMIILAAKANARFFYGKQRHQIHANNYRRYALALTQLQHERDTARGTLHANQEMPHGGPTAEPASEPAVLEGGTAG